MFQEGECVAKLLTLEADDLYRNLLKPQIKVGNEYVTQGRNKDQVYFSIGKAWTSVLPGHIGY